MSIYQRFEDAVLVILTVLIAIVIVVAVWNLTVNVLFTLVLAETLDASDYVVFQTIFGMIFTVIIALEFKRSLLLAMEHSGSVVQVRTVILLAMLAIIRKLIILEFAAADALQLFGLAAAILALGAVYGLVREQDRREAD